MAIRDRLSGRVRKSEKENAGQVEMLNSLAHNGLLRIGSQPTQAKGGAVRAGPLTRLKIICSHSSSHIIYYVISLSSFYFY